MRVVEGSEEGGGEEEGEGEGEGGGGRGEGAGRVGVNREVVIV